MEPVSKILILGDARSRADGFRAFCEDCALVGIRPPREDEASVMRILESNVDLGGIVLNEHFGGEPGGGVALARKIHRLRPELPLFLRRESIDSVAGLPERDAALFRCAFTDAHLEQLRASLETSIFSRVYPTALVRGIADITRSSLETVFRHCDVDVETPYLVKDRIIYGEVFTLIALESHWCRGYMMFQGAEQALLELIRENADEGGEAVGFRDLNHVMGEATNLVWGGFKTRYVDDDRMRAGSLRTQVPIIVNHHRSYISFGSDDPQLCLKYTLRDRAAKADDGVPIYQRFVFNLSWSPEDFAENQSVDSMVSSGELELF